MTPPTIQTTRTFHIEFTSRDMSLATRKTACPIIDPTRTAVAAHRPRPRMSPSGFPASDVCVPMNCHREFGCVVRRAPFCARARVTSNPSVKKWRLATRGPDFSIARLYVQNVVLRRYPMSARNAVHSTAGLHGITLEMRESFLDGSFNGLATPLYLAD